MIARCFAPAVFSRQPPALRPNSPCLPSTRAHFAACARAIARGVLSSDRCHGVAQSSPPLSLQLMPGCFTVPARSYARPTIEHEQGLPYHRRVSPTLFHCLPARAPSSHSVRWQPATRRECKYPLFPSLVHAFSTKSRIPSGNTRFCTSAHIVICAFVSLICVNNRDNAQLPGTTLSVCTLCALPVGLTCNFLLPHTKCMSVGQVRTIRERR